MFRSRFSQVVATSIFFLVMQGQQAFSQALVNVAITDPIANQVLTPSTSINVTASANTVLAPGTYQTNCIIINVRTGLPSVKAGPNITIGVGTPKSFTISGIMTPAGISGDNITVQVTVSSAVTGGTQTINCKY